MLKTEEVLSILNFLQKINQNEKKSLFSQNKDVVNKGIATVFLKFGNREVNYLKEVLTMINYINKNKDELLQLLFNDSRSNVTDENIKALTNKINQLLKEKIYSIGENKEQEKEKKHVK